MSYSDPPPPHPPFMPMPFAGGDIGEVWPQSPMNHEFPESYSQFDHAPPFKRLRNSDNNSPNSANYTPTNSRVNQLNLIGNKGTSHIFFKTRMCAKFMEGTCRNGEHCTFAHGVEDLREPPPNWQELVREKDRGVVGNWNDDQKIIHRMKICKKFYNGEECPYGDKCNFLHERPPKFKADIPRQRESSAISIGTTGNRSDAELNEISKHGIVDSDAVRIKPIYWKTKMCSKWETTGQCPFRDRCHFAHGQSELQVPSGPDLLMNSLPIMPRPFSVPLVELSSANAVVNASIQEEKEDKKILKWKLTKKIYRIYADWIDDLVPPHLLASKADS
ncbi:zinc finger CCCH domain-containing protein 39 [Nicotiana tomentosiformis]|uniref:zinc finger CCCH domain-containing protein 39 n=1 Tax=Nicotiana tomentosiformis TaxID=4098 RepID=UPI00051AD3B3|nr:zinc finger CCCH domain-containing protein 39 [Nicotiana tomentosiformis]XP_009630796.1 zinc finger CCCH domain-containing protein 39 [Nicotiana tomentosiformis]XP_033508573.1 zinc finger CCCH domain-containing protein 39 [Nicotiana tomentosiformis]